MARVFLILTISLMVAGCAGTVNEVKILPAPMRTFPPTESALIRLPVVLLFPSDKEVFQHVTDFFKKGLRLKMDDLIMAPGVHLKFSVSDIWKKFQEPIYLDKDIWLLIRPQTLSLGSVRMDPRNFLTAHAGLETTANPELIFGPKPLTIPLAMPALSKFIPGPPTFQAVSNTFISYQEADAHLKDPRLKLIGMSLKGTGQEVTLQGIRMYGSGGKVVVEVKLRYEPLILNLGSKPAKMTLYLKGTPHYLPDKQEFDLPDLDYDIKSSDLMVQMADMFFKNDFRKQLRKVARLPVGAKLDKLKEKINLALNRKLGHFTRLSAKVDFLKILDGLASNEGIIIRVFIQGTAALEVTWN